MANPTPLSDQQITTALGAMAGWERDGNLIRKTYELDSYPQGLAFATAAGMVADGFNHHPDMMVGYKKVTLEFTTHDADSQITQKDIDVAQAIEAITIRR